MGFPLHSARRAAHHVERQLRHDCASVKPVSYATCKQAFAEAREKARLDKVKIHDLRAKSLTDTKRQERMGKDHVSAESYDLYRSTFLG